MPQQPLAQVPVDAQWFWQERGSCREVDPMIFFHPQNERGSARAKRDRTAKQVCAACNVRLECADYAVRAREPYGVWRSASGSTPASTHATTREPRVMDFESPRATSRWPLALEHWVLRSRAPCPCTVGQ